MGLIKQILSRYVSGGISSTVYHLTNARNAVSILSENRFKMSKSDSEDYDRSKKGKPYFLSTARSLLSNFIQSSINGGDVIFVLDGDSISHKYEGSPIEYESEGVVEPEMEDRVYSPDPYLDNALSYIREVYVLHGESEYLDRFYVMARALGTRVFIFDTESDILSKNKAKARRL